MLLILEQSAAARNLARIQYLTESVRYDVASEKGRMAPHCIFDPLEAVFGKDFEGYQKSQVCQVRSYDALMVDCPRSTGLAGCSPLLGVGGTLRSQYVQSDRKSSLLTHMGPLEGIGAGAALRCDACRWEDAVHRAGRRIAW